MELAKFDLEERERRWFQKLRIFRFLPITSFSKLPSNIDVEPTLEN